MIWPNNGFVIVIGLDRFLPYSMILENFILAISAIPSDKRSILEQTPRRDFDLLDWQVAGKGIPGTVPCIGYPEVGHRSSSVGRAVPSAGSVTGSNPV